VKVSKVSIPLWFNSNIPILPILLILLILSLNSTLVQFKPKRKGVKFVPIREESQFHFGSIQTLSIEDVKWSEIVEVSIPLWFNSNVELVTL